MCIRIYTYLCVYMYIYVLCIEEKWKIGKMENRLEAIYQSMEFMFFKMEKLVGCMYVGMPKGIVNVLKQKAD